MDERKATPGVHFPDKFGSPVTMLKVPVGTKQNDLVVASDEKSGAVYPKAGGHYRVAAVLEPGENATSTFAMCYRDAVPKRQQLSQSAAVAEAVLAGNKANAEAISELAKAVAMIGALVVDNTKATKK